MQSSGRVWAARRLSEYGAFRFSLSSHLCGTRLPPFQPVTPAPLLRCDLEGSCVSSADKFGREACCTKGSSDSMALHW
jgi:hypothetical protein